MNMLLESTPLLYAGVIIFGLLIGSFLNVVILRYPAKLEHEWHAQCQELLELDRGTDKQPPGLIVSRSRCPECNHAIRPWENIPVLSYLFLVGRCSSCKARISVRYPFVELATAVLFVLVIWHLGPNVKGFSALLLTAYLIAMTGIDIDHQLLPDMMTIPLMWAGILLSFWTVFTNLQSSVVGAIAGYLALWIVYHLFRILTGKEGMGYGDFKLLAALGAWIGWQMLPVVILLSSVFGTIVGLFLMGSGKLGRDKPMPFGPFLAVAGWATLMWGQEIANVYRNSGIFG